MKNTFESPERTRRMRVADEITTAFLEGDRETYLKALALRNAVAAEADLEPWLLFDLHTALRKAALTAAGRRRLLTDFETTFSLHLEESASRATVPEPRDMQAARLEAAEEAYAVLKPVKGDDADKARHLRNVLAEAKLPPRELVASVSEALLDALMKPAPEQEPAKIREACRKFETAFSELGI